MAWDTSALEAHLRRMEAEMRKAAVRGCADVAHEGLLRSSEICPIEEATLVRSGTVDTNDEGAAWGFGHGGAGAYAIPQHERLDYRHDNGREAKYVESVHRSMGASGEVLRIIGARVQAVIR